MRNRSKCAVAVALCVLMETLIPVVALAADVPSGVAIPATITNDTSGDVGAVVEYKIGADVMDSSGKVIIPAGSTGTGTIVEYHASAGFGGPGKTVVGLDQVTTPSGSKMTVKANANKYGGDARVASILLLGLWGFFSKGGSGKIGPGTTVRFVAQ